MKNNLYLLMVVLLMVFIAPQKAEAYLDPGTGSMILQMIIAGLVGVGCTFRMWKDKVLGLLKKDKNDK